MIGNKKTELLYGIKKVAFTILLILTRTNIHVCCWLKRTCTCGMDRRSYWNGQRACCLSSRKPSLQCFKTWIITTITAFLGVDIWVVLSPLAHLSTNLTGYFFNLISETQSPPTCQIVNLVIRRFRNKVLKRWLVVTRLVTLLPKCWTINA